MQLHRAQSEALRAFVTAIEIKPNRKTDVRGWSKLLAFQEQILKAPHWRDLLGPDEFLDIVWGAMWAALNTLPQVDDAFAARLDDPQCDAIAQRVNEFIASALEALPHHYHVYVPLGGLSELGSAVVALVPGIDLVDAASDKSLAERLNRAHPKYSNALVRIMSGDPGNHPTNPAVLTRYLRISGVGYASGVSDSPVVRSALATAKHFVNLALQEGAVDVSPVWMRRWDHLPDEDRTAAIVLRADVDEGKRIDMPIDLMSFLNRVRFVEAALMVREPGLSLLSGKVRAPSTAEEMSLAIQSCMPRTMQFLALDNKLEDAVRVRAAMEWEIDAAATSNETIAFLQRCIALEALLGSDEGQRGVTDRLSDRYAYLLGQTESQREKYRSLFRKMYGHRSNIVHGRAGRLSEEQRRAGWDAQAMLASVIFKETGNVLRFMRQANGKDS